MTPANIAAEYARREAEAGGLANCDVSAIIDAMASDMGLSRTHIADALRQEWAMGGAG